MARNSGFQPEGRNALSVMFQQKAASGNAQIVRQIGQTVAAAKDLQWGLVQQGCDGSPNIDTLENVACCTDAEANCPPGGTWALINRQRGIPTLVSGTPSRPFASVSGLPVFTSLAMADPCDLAPRISLLDSKGNKWHITDGSLRATGVTPWPARVIPDAGRFYEWDNDDFYRLYYGTIWGATLLFCGDFAGEIGWLVQGAVNAFGSIGYPVQVGTCPTTGCGAVQTDDLVFCVDAAVGSSPLTPDDDIGYYGVTVRSRKNPALTGGGKALARSIIPGDYPAASSDMDLCVCEEGSTFVHETGNKRIYQYRYDRDAKTLALVRTINLDPNSGAAWDSSTVIGAVLEPF